MDLRCSWNTHTANEMPHSENPCHFEYLNTQSDSWKLRRPDTVSSQILLLFFHEQGLHLLQKFLPYRFP